MSPSGHTHCILDLVVMVRDAPERYIKTMTYSRHTGSGLMVLDVPEWYIKTMTYSRHTGSGLMVRGVPEWYIKTMTYSLHTGSGWDGKGCPRVVYTSLCVDARGLRAPALHSLPQPGNRTSTEVTTITKGRCNFVLRRPMWLSCVCRPTQQTQADVAITIMSIVLSGLPSPDVRTKGNPQQQTTEHQVLRYQAGWCVVGLPSPDVRTKGNPQQQSTKHNSSRWCREEGK